jgi:N utilization substance protein A
MILDIKKIEAAVNQIAAEKKLDKHKIVEVIAAAIKTAYKKMAGSKDINVNVNIDLENESIDITVEKTIVKTVEDPMVEISLAELKEL